MTKSDFEKFLVLHPEFDKDPINENMTTQQNIQNFQESQSSSKGKKKKLKAKKSLQVNLPG